MGVTVEIWRARIGGFLKPGSCVRHSVKIHFALDSYTFHLFVISLLLIIGNVETNPGPTYKCHVEGCNSDFPSLESNMTHQRIHSTLKNFTFKCPSITCTKNYNSYSGLRSHVSDFHGKAECSTPDTAGTSSSNLEVIVCPEENCLKHFSHTKEFCHHIIREHIEKHEHVQCPFKIKCSSSTFFKIASGFRSHLSLKHSGWRENDMDFDLSLLRREHHTDPASDESVVGADEPEYMDTEECFTSWDAFDNSMFFKHIGSFYLMLEADCFLAEKTIQKISEHLATMSELVQYQTKRRLREELRSVGLTEEIIESVLNKVCCSDVFYAAHHKSSPGPTLTSEHLRKEYIKENFVYIQPQEIPLDSDREGGPKVHYIPIKDTLELLFKDASIQEQIEDSFLESKSSSQDVYQDYYDGEVWQKRPKEREYIDLFLYQDGFTSAKNALGSAKKKLKYVGVYFTIGNLKPHNRSKTDSINLTLLIEEQLLQEYGIAACFKPLLDELKKLGISGVQFKQRNITVRVHFIVGDNLGSHKIGGFTESFSGAYFCRFCELTRIEFRKDPTAVKDLRTAEDYMNALKELVAIKERKPDKVTHRGVKEDSEFNTLPEFHVTDPGLPVCLGHDIFEGVASWDLKAMIDYFVNKVSWFTYEELSTLINNFKYIGSDVGNKPAPVVEDKKSLNGHMVQNWTLLRLLPFIIETKVKDTNDKVWKLYLKLKLIIEYVCAPCLHKNDTEKGEKLIVEYLTERKSIIPAAGLKPKYHYFRHYMDFYRLFGPLVYVWTLRFEAKHQFFKRIVRICNNVINLGWTLAHRHQLWFSYLTSGIIYPRGIGDMDKSKTLNIQDYEGNVKSALIEGNFASDSMAMKSITHDGVCFRENTYLLLGRGADGKVVVGLIKVIVIRNDEVYFVVQKFSANFWAEYGVFRIDEENPLEVCTIEASDLSNPIATSVYEFHDHSCFSCKHLIL